MDASPQVSVQKTNTQPIWCITWTFAWVRPRPSFSWGRLPFEMLSSTQSSSLLRTRNDLSHLYKKRRRPTLSEHIKFQWREQHFCENVRLARGLGGSAAIGADPRQEEFPVSGEHRNVTKQIIVGPFRKTICIFITFWSFSETARSNNV